MKLIIAIVRPFKVAEIVDAVEEQGGMPGMTVLDCRGFGREKSRPHTHASGEDMSDFVDRRTILVAATDAQADDVVRRLTRLARTGQHGDGKVFVVPMDAAERIATGETGDEAIR